MTRRAHDRTVAMMEDDYLDPGLRAELERRGPANVREALRKTPPGGFVEFRRSLLPPIKIRPRSVEEWLRENEREGDEKEALKARRERRRFFWTMVVGVIAAIAAIVAAVAAIMTISTSSSPAP